MSESHVETGILKILEHSKVYESWQYLVRSKASYQRYSDEFVKPFPGARILDIGCGTGMVLDYLPKGIEYVGFDVNPKYIKDAQRKYNGRGKFICSRVSEASLPQINYFDIVMANAILHHLEDEEALAVIKMAKLALKPGGYLVSYENVFIPGQNPFARLLIKNDRGKNVRYKEGYLNLVKPFFDKVEHWVIHDFYRIPNTIMIMKCFK